jgi:hypothetical protein
MAELDAALAAEEIMPDTGPGMEWYRELADEDAVPRVAGAP